MVAQITAQGGGLDDAPIVQTALATESVELVGGGFLFDTIVTVPSNRFIRGDGWHTDILIGPGKGNSYRPIQAVSAQDVILERFRVDHNGPNQVVSGQEHTIWGDDVQRLTLRGLHLSNPPGDSIALHSSTGGSVEDVTIEQVVTTDQGRAAISLLGSTGHYARGITIKDTQCHQGNRVPGAPNVVLVDFEPAQPGLVEDITIENLVLDGSGLSFGFAASNTTLSRGQNISIKGVKVHNRELAAFGLYMHRCAFAKVEDVRLEGFGKWGFTWRDSDVDHDGTLQEAGYLAVKRMAVVGDWEDGGISCWHPRAAPVSDPIPGGVSFEECVVDGVGTRPDNIGRGIRMDWGPGSVTLSDCIARNTMGDAAFWLRDIPQSHIMRCHAINQEGVGFHLQDLDRLHANDCTYDTRSGTGIAQVGSVGWDQNGIDPAASPTIGWSVGVR